MGGLPDARTRSSGPQRLRGAKVERLPMGYCDCTFAGVRVQTPATISWPAYCQRAVEYEKDGHSSVVSARSPLRYSRTKMELRARDFGRQKSPPDTEMTPEQWIAEEKLMPGALQDYIDVEDFPP